MLPKNWPLFAGILFFSTQTSLIKAAALPTSRSSQQGSPSTTRISRARTNSSAGSSGSLGSSYGDMSSTIAPEAVEIISTVPEERVFELEEEKKQKAVQATTPPEWQAALLNNQNLKLNLSTSIKPALSNASGSSLANFLAAAKNSQDMCPTTKNIMVWNDGVTVCVDAKHGLVRLCDLGKAVFQKQHASSDIPLGYQDSRHTQGKMGCCRDSAGKVWLAWQNMCLEIDLTQTPLKSFQRSLCRTDLATSSSDDLLEHGYNRTHFSIVDNDLCFINQIKDKTADYELRRYHKGTIVGRTPLNKLHSVHPITNGFVVVKKEKSGSKENYPLFFLTKSNNAITQVSLGLSNHHPQIYNLNSTKIGIVLQTKSIPIRSDATPTTATSLHIFRVDNKAPTIVEPLHTILLSEDLHYRVTAITEIAPDWLCIISAAQDIATTTHSLFSINYRFTGTLPPNHASSESDTTSRETNFVLFRKYASNNEVPTEIVGLQAGNYLFTLNAAGTQANLYQLTTTSTSQPIAAKKVKSGVKTE